MNKKDFMKAMSMIDDDLMREAENAGNTGNVPEGNTVSGVERYSVPAWKRIAAMAATLLLVIGVGAAGTYYLSRRGAPAPDEERIIAASTAEASQAETEQNAEGTTVPTRKRDKLAKTTIKDEATKEDTNTTSVEGETGSGEQAEAPTNADGSSVQGVCGNDGEEHQPTESDPPVTTAQTTAVPVTTQAPQTTVKTNSISESERKDPDWYPGIDAYDSDYDIFAELAKNSYSTPSSDGIPEYRLVAPDGTVYQINLTEQWVWRRTPDMSPFEETPEAMLTVSQWYYLKIHGADVGMREDIYGW